VARPNNITKRVIAANILDNMWALCVPFKLEAWSANWFHDIVWPHMSTISQGTNFRIDIVISPYQFDP